MSNMQKEDVEKTLAQEANPGFVHLHVHSHFSMLSAVPKPKELAAAAKADGQTALAVTDLGGMYGAVEFWESCTNEGIKPIIGLEAFIAPRTRHDRDGTLDKARTRVVFLAKNNDGYVNLIKMTTDSFCEGFYYTARIDRELIKKYAKDLICIIPAYQGETTEELKNTDIEKAREIVNWYRDIFGDDLYLEITHHPEIHGNDEIERKIVDLAKSENIPLVAGHDVYYLNKDDHMCREVMLKIKNGGVLDTFGDNEDDHEDFSLLSRETMQRYFKEYPEALTNTVKIAEQCTVTMTPGQVWHFPNYIIESGKEPDAELHDRAYEGYKKRGYSLDNKKAIERLEYELDVIRVKGYAKYFLVVGDLLREARERDILTTIRGSVAGSFTTYVLGITNVDPLEYKLPFQRFLNPERPSAPDIDMDYADNRRDEIINYSREKYGHDKVAQIGTFGTMLARAAVRDVARALGHPYSMGDKIAKLIPMGSQGAKMTITKALDIEPDLAALYKEDSEAQEVIDLAKKIEGRVRQLGVHAAGVVIAPEPLNVFVPVQPDPKTGKLITQYESHSVGEDGVGLLKFDFLGIRNLAILADAVRNVRETRGIEIDIENIPIDDPKTFQILTRGETMGLFQLNGSGMTSFLKQLKPTTIHDINAMVALYRPGPMESIPDYIARKQNPAIIKYLDPRLEKILDRSFGVITYQDDVMMIAIELAGYSWLDADKLRKAMGKKIPEVMEAEKDKLFKGFKEHGKLSDTVAQQLWALIEPFAAYGFNKAHAASYGRVAYQTAYMKANYPVEYMTAVLTAESGDTEKISDIIHECSRMGVPVLPPDINESKSDFGVILDNDGKPKEIRFGLATIKNFGEGIAQAIVDERERNGAFSDMTNFLRRVGDKNLNRKSMEALITVGAFGNFGENRATLLHNLDTLLAFHREELGKKEASQDSLFDLMGSDHELSRLNLTSGPDISNAQKLAWEKDLLGVYVSGHPLDDYLTELKKRTTIQQIKRDAREGTNVITAGMIDSIKPLLTKKGDHMAFVTLANRKDTIEMVTFPKTFTEYKEILEPGRVVAIKAKVSVRNDEVSLLVDAIRPLDLKEHNEPEQTTEISST